jgi:zinc transporter 12
VPGFFAFYIGVSIPSDSDAGIWVLTVTAGMFIYVSLVDLLPSVMAGPKWSWKGFVLSNMGLWLGFSIMFILVIFERYIKI